MDERPPVWIGHAVHRVTDLEQSAEFWRELGLREVGRDENVVVMELRGGTHLILLPGTPPESDDEDAPFDLMVDDLEATHEQWHTRGLGPSPIEHGRIHSAFSVRDPDGYKVTVSNSHVMGPV
jgi:catechol 2,3-dioxygenase-like lactoylglutathione lyase family enzyme